MKPRRGGLTAEQSRAVQAALPDLNRLARSLARKCPKHRLDELKTLAEDALMARVHRWDPAKGTLMAFAGKDVRKDVIRAAYSRANDPCVAKGLSAMDAHEDGIEPLDTATRWAESPEDKDARAIALGQNEMAAAYYAYCGAGAASSPEDEYGTREAFESMKRAIAKVEPRAPELFDLVFEQELGWEEAANRLGVDLRQARRIAERAFERLRAMLGARERGGR